MIKTICVVTGSRAEYGLLYWLMKEIDFDKSLNLQIVVTGMHLSSEFGNTYQQIENDGFTIDKKVDIGLLSDSELGISKSIGAGVIGFSEAFSDLKPDLCLVLGDRFEILSAVVATMIAKIPVAHLHGGELTEGAFDDAIRHSITKMSHLHFVATNTYRDRVIQLGENPKRVFNVGGLGIESINKLDLLSRVDYEERIGFQLAKRNILITYHPVTLDKSSTESQFQVLLNSINNLQDTNIIFTGANSDTNGSTINQMIKEYVSIHKNTIFIKSMGQLVYLSSLQFVDVVMGNSSSGLCEAPSFKIATVNIGDRQKGRIKADSIIDCELSENSIKAALERAYSDEFQSILSNVRNPYDSGDTSKKIVSIVKKANLTNIVKKVFFDLT